MKSFAFFSAFSTRSHYHIPAIFPILDQRFAEFGNYSERFFKNCFSVVFFWNFRNVASFCSKNHRNRLSEHGERVFQSLQLAIENVHTQNHSHSHFRLWDTWLLCVNIFNCKLQTLKNSFSMLRQPISMIFGAKWSCVSEVSEKRNTKTVFEKSVAVVSKLCKTLIWNWENRRNVVVGSGRKCWKNCRIFQ